MKSRDLIKMRRLNTGNVSSKGSKEIHTSFYFDKTLQGSRRVESKRGRVLYGILSWHCDHCRVSRIISKHKETFHSERAFLY